MGTEANPGLLPRIAHDLIARVDALSKEGKEGETAREGEGEMAKEECAISVSFMDLYNEEVRVARSFSCSMCRGAS